MTKEGLGSRTGRAVAAILKHVLAEECRLAATTRDFRWKITGPNFQSLHRLFDEQRHEIEFWLDQVMARTRAIGLRVNGRPGTAPMSGQPVTTRVPAMHVIRDLLALHERMARRLRQYAEACGVRLNDRGTADLLARLVDFHETTAWMLQTLLNTPEAHRN